MRQCLKRSNKSESDTHRERSTRTKDTQRERTHTVIHTQREAHTQQEKEAHTYTQ